MYGCLRKRGNSWYYSFELASVDGKRKRIERFGGRTKKEAENTLRKAVQEYELAGLLFEPSEISVSDYMYYWLENYVELNCKSNTINGYRGIVKNHIIPAFGVYKLKSITPTILQDFVNKKYLTGISKNYLISITTLLSSSFKYAVHPCEFIKTSPMMYVTRPKYDHSKTSDTKKAISIDIFEKIIERFPVNTTFHIMLMIGFYTGLRIGEVTSLTWNDIDLVEKTLSVNTSLLKQNGNWYFGSTKTSSSVRVISIGDTLVNALIEQKNWQDRNKELYGIHYINQYEFNEIKNQNILRRIRSLDSNIKLDLGKPVNMICTKENGKLITSESFKYAAKIIHYELELEFNFHSLRHTHASLLIQNGANIKDVQLRLGHSKITTTLDTYTHGSKSLSQQSTDIFESLTQKNTNKE